MALYASIIASRSSTCLQQPQFLTGGSGLDLEQHVVVWKACSDLTPSDRQGFSASSAVSSPLAQTSDLDYLSITRELSIRGADVRYA